MCSIICRKQVSLSLLASLPRFIFLLELISSVLHSGGDFSSSFSSLDLMNNMFHIFKVFILALSNLIDRRNQKKNVYRLFSWLVYLPDICMFLSIFIFVGSIYCVDLSFTFFLCFNKGSPIYCRVLKQMQKHVFESWTAVLYY